MSSTDDPSAREEQIDKFHVEGAGGSVQMRVEPNVTVTENGKETGVEISAIAGPWSASIELSREQTRTLIDGLERVLSSIES